MKRIGEYLYYFAIGCLVLLICVAIVGTITWLTDYAATIKKLLDLISPTRHYLMIIFLAVVITWLGKCFTQDLVDFRKSIRKKE